MNAIYLVAPTDHNINRIITDYANPDEPMYSKAHLFFTSHCSQANLQKLARSKAIGRVKTLKETNLEYLVYDSQTFHFDSPKSFYNLYSRSGQQQQEQTEIADKLASLCATLGENPIVRYSRANTNGSAIASLVHERLDGLRRSGKMSSAKTDRSVLLILDRTYDLVSPVVHELTYQAMVEDCIPAIENDVYSYNYTDNNNQSQKREVILNENDIVWDNTRQKHIQHAKSWIATKFKAFREQSKDMRGTKDITKTLRAMPKYQTLKAKFSVHLNLAKECMDVFNRTGLERICGIEQELATGLDEYNESVKNISTKLMPILNEGTFSKENKIRLLMLHYATDSRAQDSRQRFESAARLSSAEEKILSNYILLKDFTTRTEQRRPPVSDKEWEFVVSRYLPALHDVVAELASGSLNSKEFPFLNKEEESYTASSSSNYSKRKRPAARGWGNQPTVASRHTSAQKEGGRLIIFMSGGVTYSEMREVQRLSKQFNRDILIGSTHILKPNQLLAQVGALTSTITDAAYTPSVIRT
eukprot:TRINITY_DN10601_c0_g1_i1.p1 TRINITY_DN10601_c0_g1~~TRINITY_DN10601_c0_g1_i1.p1  ORF type:complete len:614 (-),score=152.54 TRINITY_DN10601_c0_g1_i1:136-1725(-)